MQKHFAHVYKMLISPAIVPKHEGGFISRYMKNRQTMKYCKNLWPELNKQYLIDQGVNLRRQVKKAIDQQDKVLLMKVCSIPLYEKLTKQIKTVRLSSWGYHFQFLNIYKVEGGPEYLSSENTLNPLLRIPSWIRVEFKFKEELNNKKLVDRIMWIQRKIHEDNMPAQKKWYIHQLQY